MTALPEPQAPKVKARKISVKEMGKPTKIENSIAASISRPMVGFCRSNAPPPAIAPHQSPNGTVLGKKVEAKINARRMT